MIKEDKSNFKKFSLNKEYKIFFGEESFQLYEKMILEWLNNKTTNKKDKIKLQSFKKSLDYKKL